MATTLEESDEILLDRLRRRLYEHPLPGRSAQQEMAPKLRGEYGDPPADARRAAILALLYPVEAKLHLLYIQRTSPANDRHAGQIGFPGGSVESTDTSTEATALRETEEEVGVSRTEVEVLGALTPLYIPVSNFLVDPYVGLLRERPTLIPQTSEVARTLEVPLSGLLEKSARRTGTRLLSSGLKLPDTPYWAVGEEEIWGATAMMTAELIALLREQRV